MAISKKKYIIYLLIAVGIYLLILAVIGYLYKSIKKSPQRRMLDEYTRWHYYDQAIWDGECNKGKKQSPILLKQKAAVKRQVNPLHFENFEKCECLLVENTGRAVVVRLGDECDCLLPEISGGNLEEDEFFKFEYVKFHWPSEHIVDDASYPLEGQFVFYNERFPDYKSAVDGNESIVILCVLFRTYTSGEHFEALSEAVIHVSSSPDSTFHVEDEVDFNTMLPKNRDSFFTYSGSMTEPMCPEIVRWIVLTSPANISLEDFDDFTYILDEKGKLLYSNRRKPQALNGRTVTLNIANTEEID